MKEFLPMTIFCMFMAILSHRNSGYDPINCEYHHKDWFFYSIVVIVLGVFAGLRTGYNDTGTYVEMYHATIDSMDKLTSLTDGLNWLKFGENPGFELVMRLMAKAGLWEQNLIMFFSLFYVTVNLWFFRKYSYNLWLSVLLYISFAGYIFSLAAIKQCTAMALCLIATDRAIQKKYIQFVLFVFLGALFHAYALMYLMVPFLFFRPWSKSTLIMLTVFAVAGVCLESLLGTLVNVTDMLGENYDAESFIGEGVNPIRLLVTAVPLLFSLLNIRQIAEHKERDQYVIVNLTMLNAEIMFVALFGTANYFARLANYFIPFQAVSIPWLLKQNDYEGRRIMTLLVTSGYALFFIYTIAINENFDANFYSWTIWEYFDQILARALPGA